MLRRLKYLGINILIFEERGRETENKTARGQARRILLEGLLFIRPGQDMHYNARLG